MQKIKSSFEHLHIFSHLVKWTCITLPIAILIGSVVAFFLAALEYVTEFRQQQGWLLWLLPAAGVGIYFLYKRAGRNAERGNNLIMDEIHQPGGGIPFRMAPLVLATTVITHLFGGSAGREGTAVQIGGSISAYLGRKLGLDLEDTRILLMTGIAAGFGSVFGTPLTGAIFALEVLTLGKINHRALLPCFMASAFADMVCSAWGIHHTAYHIDLSGLLLDGIPVLHLHIALLGKVILAGLCFGLASYFFSNLSHAIQKYSQRLIAIPWLIPVAGGCLVIALTYLLGTTAYLGLGVSHPDPEAVSILSSFQSGGADYWSWFWKLLFTAITLGTGFKGGEVTPLFFIGAALGNTLAVLTGAPVGLMAGLGFIAVFAGATNTPIACTLMGVELFGGEYILYYAVACFTAYYFSGHSGIYSAQRLGVRKGR